MAEKSGDSRKLVSVPGGLNAWLSKQRTEIARALPRMISPDQFIRIALTTVKQDQYLMEADPTSFMAAVFEAAQAGLLIDGVLGHAYLVSFWSSKRNTRLVQLIPGYKGLIELARRSGEIAKVEARVVRPGDRFRYRYGLEQLLEHEPVDVKDGELEAWSHVYGIAWFKDRSTPAQFEVMSRAEVMAIKKRSASVAKGRSSPWDTDEIPMAQKTVLRRLCRLLPLSVGDQRIVAKDEAFDAGVRQAEFEVRSPGPSTVEDLSEPAESQDPDEDAPESLAGEPKDGEPVEAPESSQETGSGQEGWDYENQGDPPPWVKQQAKTAPQSKATKRVTRRGLL